MITPRANARGGKSARGSVPKFSDKDFYSCTQKVVAETLDKIKDKSPAKRASVVVNLNKK